MSKSDGGPVSVSAAGITVNKRLETERFPTLAVELEIASEREDKTRVRLSDTIPADIPVDDVGFHPNFGEGFWSVIDDDTVAFERELAPGETYITIYGFRDFPEERYDELLSEPEIDLGDGDVEPHQSETTDPEPAVNRPVSGGVVRAVVNELRGDVVGPEERDMLREELNDIEGFQEAQVRDLQEQVSDFEAYIGALENFLRKHGTAEQVFERFERDLAEVEDGIEAMTEEVEPVFDRVEALDERLETIQDDLESTESRFDRVGNGFDDTEEKVDEIESRMDGYGVNLDEISGDVDGVENRAEEAEREISDLQAELDELRNRLREDVQEIEDDLEDFGELRDRLASVFGSDVGAAGSLGGGTDDEEAETDEPAADEPDDDEGETDESAADEPEDDESETNESAEEKAEETAENDTDDESETDESAGDESEMDNTEEE